MEWLNGSWRGLRRAPQTIIAPARPVKPPAAACGRQCGATAFSFGLVLSIGLLLLASLLLSAALAAWGHWASGWLPLPTWVVRCVACA